MMYSTAKTDSTAKAPDAEPACFPMRKNTTEISAMKQRKCSTSAAPVFSFLQEKSRSDSASITEKASI